MNALSASFTLAMILVCWFETDFFNEYLGWSGFFYLDQYRDVKEAGGDLSYLEFLLEYHNCFLVRLISCPICTSVWVGFFLALLFGQLSFVACIALLGLLLYKLYLKIS